jgi:hypothetical protein
MRRLLEGRIERLGGEIALEVSENVKLRVEVLLLEGKIAYMERERLGWPVPGSVSNPIYLE